MKKREHPEKKYEEAINKYRSKKLKEGWKLYKIGLIPIILIFIGIKAPIFFNSKIETGEIKRHLYYRGYSSPGTYGTIGGHFKITRSVAKFIANGKTYYAVSASNMDYPVGQKVKVIYNIDNPEKSHFYSFLNLFSDYLIIFPVVFFLWTGISFRLPSFYISKPAGVPDYYL